MPSNATTTVWDGLSNPSILVASTVVAVILLPLIFSGLGNSKGSYYDLGGFSVLTAWRFFTMRYDFLQGNFARTGKKIFQFHVLQVDNNFCYQLGLLLSYGCLC